MPDAAPAIVFDQVSVVFGKRPEQALPYMDKGLSRREVSEATGQILGVHDCSLTVQKGEILVLMGLSGSGKSTLLRAVNGLNPVTRGQLSLHSETSIIDVAGAGGQTLQHLRRHHVAMVFQQFGLLPWRTVRANIGLGLELAGIRGEDRDQRISAQLELVGLTDRAEAKVSELSGGMQQRVGLARAYATSAPVLLMDEPFSALDPLIRTHLQDELIEHQRKLNCSIVFVSHDLEEAFKLGNRIAIMDEGRIVQTGTPRQIFHQPSTDYVQRFVAQINPLQVLTAEDILACSQLSAGRHAPSLSRDINTPASVIMSLMHEHDGPISITREDKAIGQIDKDALLFCLASYNRK